MRPPPFVFFDVATHINQKYRNNYFYEHLGMINQYMVKYNKSYEWKMSMIYKLAELVGYPKKLTIIQKIFS